MYFKIFTTWQYHPGNPRRPLFHYLCFFQSTLSSLFTHFDMILRVFTHSQAKWTSAAAFVYQKCTNDNRFLCTQLTSSRNRFKSCCLPESGYSFRLEVNIHLWGSFVLKWPPCLKRSHSLIVLTAEWTKRPKGCLKTSVLLMLCYWHSWQHTSFLECTGPITMKLQRLFVKMCWRR